MRYLARSIDRSFAVSEDARRMAREALGGTYTVLYNGVELDRFRDVDPWPTDGRRTIFFIGRHEPRKGLAVLLDAMTRLPTGVRLWVAERRTGDGTPARRGGRRRPQSSGSGRIDDDEKVARLRAADVFCAPSLHGESFGIVLLEAMAAGTAVVATELAGYARVVRAGIDGVLVAPGDPVALADALLAGARRPRPRGRAGAGRGSHAPRSSRWRGLADRYLDAYRQLVS